MKSEKLEKLDVTKYVGTETAVNKAEFRELKHGKCIMLETAPIPLKDGDTLPDGAELKGSIILPLHENKDNEIIIGEDTKTDKFIKAKGLSVADVPDYEQDSTIEMFIGLKVIVQKNDRGFLEIA